MTSTQKLKVILIIMMLAFIFASCSGSSESQTPITPGYQDSDVSSSFDSDKTNGRSIIAVYDALIDPVTKTFTVIPVNRESSYHFPLTQLYPNVLQITGYGFSPTLWADIKLVHPYPGSQIAGFDPRVIAILPALDPDWAIHYPVFNVNANSGALLFPDGYTKMHDDLGGSITGNTNPYMSYFKTKPYRVWAPFPGWTEETKKWYMNKEAMEDCGYQFKLVVDVCTNYPDSPQPVVDNAIEPIPIELEVGDGLLPDGGSATVTATILDWQGTPGIKCKVESPDLFEAAVELFYNGPGPNPNEYIYEGTITNTLGASHGDHGILLAAWDSTVGNHNFIAATATVSFVPANGELIWAKSIDCTSYVQSRATTTLSDDSTVVTGWFSGTATFDKNEPNETILISNGSVDIFIARYDPDGTLAWAKSAGGGSEEECYAVTTLSDNSTVITGIFKGTAIFGEDEPNETILISNGSFDIFIARYNPDGTLAWAKSAGGPGNCYATGITVLSDNSTVITGYFNDTITFDQGEPGETILDSIGHQDSFNAMYNTDGTLAWAKNAARGGDFIESQAISSRSDNSVVITGQFGLTALFGSGQPNETTLTSAGSYDIFIACYNSDGSFAWAKSAEGTHGDECLGITMLSDNSAVITGTYHWQITFGKSEPNETILEGSPGGVAVFIARYNPDGSFLWAKDAWGYENLTANAITALADDSVVITGAFPDAMYFTFGEPNYEIIFSTGGLDIFISRYDSDGTFEWAKQAGGEGQDLCYAITTLSDNSTVNTGTFQVSATFGSGEPGETILTAYDWRDIYIARYAP